MKKLLLLFIITGCSLPLNKEIIEALSRDQASVCAHAGVRGGAGGGTLVPPVPVGGYGSAELEFCRTNFPNAKLTRTPDGAITITHGDQE